MKTCIPNIVGIFDHLNNIKQLVYTKTYHVICIHKKNEYIYLRP
jgi:hypothetical protein